MNLNRLNIYIFIFAFLAGTNFSFSQITLDKNTQLSIYPEIFDLGQIKEVDGVVSAKFTITNISKKPYILNYSYSNCGCLALKISKEPLMPNQSRDIVVQFDPKRLPGVTIRSVVLVSNNKRRLDKLPVRAEVVPIKKSIDELYPIKTSSDLSFSDDIIPLGVISQNEKHMAVLNYYNHGKSEVIMDVKIKGSERGEVTLSSKKLPPNGTGQLQFTYDLVNEEYYGMLKNSIEIYVNGKKLEKDILVNALVVFNFFEMSEDERINAPRAIVSPREYKLGEKPITIPILNNGKSDLKILKIITKNDDLIYHVDDMIIKPNKRTNLTIKRGDKDFKMGDVTLMFNSPDSPIVTIYLEIE